MLILEKNMLTEEIEKLAEQYGNSRASLMPILQAIQIKYNHISDHAQQEIARVLDIHPVEVYGVISFYAFLHADPRGRNIVRLCNTICCEHAGKDLVEKAIEREIGVKFGETTKDEKFTLEFTSCLGMCDQGPAMMINNEIYTKLDPEKACEILSTIK